MQPRYSLISWPRIASPQSARSARNSTWASPGRSGCGITSLQELQGGHKIPLHEHLRGGSQAVPGARGDAGPAARTKPAAPPGPRTPGTPQPAVPSPGQAAAPPQTAAFSSARSCRSLRSDYQADAKRHHDRANSHGAPVAAAAIAMTTAPRQSPAEKRHRLRTVATTTHRYGNTPTEVGPPYPPPGANPPATTATTAAATSAST
jgi:hypothetical protein